MRESARRLHRYCYERAGDDLRTVMIYSEDDHDFVYLRDDLRSEYHEDHLAPVLDHARAIHETLNEVSDSGLLLGQSRATVHAFDRAFVIQLLYSRTDGIIVSFELETGRNLLSFIKNCLDRVSSVPSE